MPSALSATVLADDGLTVTRTLRVEDALDDERTRIALEVLRIVLRYSPDYELADMLDAGRIEVAGDETVAVALERHVRRLAKDAEGVTVGSSVVSGVLAGRYLLDDYQRMKSVEQCDAFGHEPTHAEEVALEQYQDEARDELDRQIIASRRRIVESRQICRCGETNSMHEVRARLRREDSMYGRLPTGGRAQCSDFTPILEVELRMSVPERIEAAIDPWLLDRGLENDDDGRVRLILSTLTEMRRDAGLTVGEALALTATALDLPPASDPIYHPKRRRTAGPTAGASAS